MVRYYLKHQSVFILSYTNWCVDHQWVEICVLSQRMQTVTLLGCNRPFDTLWPRDTPLNRLWILTFSYFSLFLSCCEKNRLPLSRSGMVYSAVSARQRCHMTIDHWTLELNGPPFIFSWKSYHIFSPPEKAPYHTESEWLWCERPKGGEKTKQEASSDLRLLVSN